MIKLEHVVLPSPEQMEFIIEGMRNPMNSWDKSDSLFDLDFSEDCNGNTHLGGRGINGLSYWASEEAVYDDKYYIGPDDLSLMQKLSNAGPVHSKYMRMMTVMLRVTAGHTWWAEYDTYKVGTVRNSCSKMHKIHISEFKVEDFDHEGISEVGGRAVEAFETVRTTLMWLAYQFNTTQEKKYWRAIIELLPMGFHMTANIYLNYEVLKDIYTWRKDHKLDEWVEFCKWIETLPYSEIITGVNK